MPTKSTKWHGMLVPKYKINIISAKQYIQRGLKFVNINIFTYNIHIKQFLRLFLWREQFLLYFCRQINSCAW